MFTGKKIGYFRELLEEGLTRDQAMVKAEVSLATARIQFAKFNKEKGIVKPKKEPKAKKVKKEVVRNEDGDEVIE